MSDTKKHDAPVHEQVEQPQPDASADRTPVTSPPESPDANRFEGWGGTGSAGRKRRGGGWLNPTLDE